MRLILVRHGAAAYFEQQIVPGITGCTGLTEMGRAQASRLFRRLQQPGELPDSAILICSPLRRAVETASILSPAFTDKQARPESDLEEMRAGIADGMSWADHATQFGQFDVRQEPDRLWAPEGESWNLFAQRIRGFLDRIQQEYVGQTVVAVTHGWGDRYHNAASARHPDHRRARIILSIQHRSDRMVVVG